MFSTSEYARAFDSGCMIQFNMLSEVIACMVR